jgi:heme-degrading monooxygenase HmoA
VSLIGKDQDLECSDTGKCLVGVAVFSVRQARGKAIKESIVQARMIGFKVPPERIEEVENAYLSSFVPEMEKYEGFTFVLLIRNKDTNETLEVSIWEDEDALRESEKEGGVVDWKTNMIESITGGATAIENYEIRLIT